MGLRKAFADAETVLFYDGKRLGETDKLLPLAMNVERQADSTELSLQLVQHATSPIGNVFLRGRS